MTGSPKGCATSVARRSAGRGCVRGGRSSGIVAQRLRSARDIRQSADTSMRGAECARLRSAQQTHNPLAPFIKVHAPVVALTHVRVIDGTGAPARENQTLVIRDGNIAAIGDAALDRAARRRHRHRPDRQERHSRSRDAARAPVLHDRPRRVRTARRQLLASLPRRRRDDDADGGERERDHGHQHQPPDRRRRDAGPGDRRDRAVRQRPEHVPADARGQERRRGAARTSPTGPIRARRR